MENRAHALAAGVFVIVLGLALAAVVAWFQGDRTERTRYLVVSRHGVSGLNVKAPVKLRGVEVGKVEAIAFDPADAGQILVTISVDRAAPVTRGTYAQLGLQGVTGLSFIALEDAGRDRSPLPSTDAAPARIVLEPTLLDHLAEAGPNLVAGAAEAAQRLNRLLSDDNQARLAQALDRLGATAGEVSKLVAALQPAARELPALARHADAAVQRAEAASARIEALAGDARALAQELRTQAASLGRIGAAAQQVEASTRRIEGALVGPAVPRARPLVDELAGASRSIERSAGSVGEQPQSLLFGPPVPPPGPGEAGFERRLGGAR